MNTYNNLLERATIITNRAYDQRQTCQIEYNTAQRALNNCNKDVDKYNRSRNY